LWNAIWHLTAAGLPDGAGALDTAQTRLHKAAQGRKFSCQLVFKPMDESG
jgi:hypothetical protein